MVVLDTDHVSLLAWETGDATNRLRERLKSVPKPEIATTIVTYEEQARGWLAYVKGARGAEQLAIAYQKLHQHVDIYRKLRALEFDEAAINRFEDLQQARLRVGTQDLKIAAICLRHNATLLTRNLRDFRRVPGLKAEDWSK